MMLPNLPGLLADAALCAEDHVARAKAAVALRIAPDDGVRDGVLSQVTAESILQPRPTFALGYLGWFISPLVFMGSTAAVVVVMALRQFRSDAHDAVLAADPEP